jgi:hypothetical protein
MEFTGHIIIHGQQHSAATTKGRTKETERRFTGTLGGNNSVEFPKHLHPNFVMKRLT